MALLTEKQRRAYLLKTSQDLSNRAAARHLGIRHQSFDRLINEANRTIVAIKRIVTTAGGDPRMVDDYFRRNVLD